MADYIATCQSARTAIPAAVQMEELFGRADHFITHFGFQHGPKIWNTEVFFGGRYSLTMQVEVTVNDRANTVELVGSPRFYIIEYQEVEISPSGQVAAYSNLSGSTRRVNERKEEDKNTFSIEGWKRVYEADGDFSTIGMTLKREPVSDFEKYVAAVRKDRVPISLLK